MNLRRLRDLIFNGKVVAKELSLSSKKNFVKIWLDIIYSGLIYKIPSIKYKNTNFIELSKPERKSIGKESLQNGKAEDYWMRDFLQNRKFYAKYGSSKYELGFRRILRQRAYTKRYNVGRNLQVENNVYISRQHGLNGDIKIGNNVFLARNSTIDFSGGLTIGNDIQITKGADIQTHHHLFHTDWTKDETEVEGSPLVIEDGVIIGTRAIILPSCNRIGKHARVGAGAVVTKDVPDYAVVVGVPAKIIRIMNKSIE